MKISVITVVLNAADTIEDTLRSVASQTYSSVEHIVVDGGSTDGTLSIIERHRGRIATLIAEPDRGIYDAMNKGIDAASGDLVGMLNADDVYIDEHVLEKIARAFADPAIGACYADLVYVDRSDLDKIVRYWQSCPYTDGLFERGWLPAHPTFFLRRELYRRYGGFDLRYRFQADFELTMRLLAVHKVRSVYLPEVLVKMRMGGVSNRSVWNVIQGNLEAYRACRLHGLKVSPLFIARKILSRLPQFFRRPPVV
ncbi:MAG: glycosyltransferase [Gammaproteobacteria bacterium]|nr:glycosyltransferase [Gammaproteobacteria bacterium]